MIKKLFIFLLLPVALVSCFDDSTPQYAPYIATSIITSNTNDTLYTRQEADGYRLDTVSVGDTVRFAVTFDAYFNSLRTARITWDSAYVDLTVGKLDSVNNVLLPTSDPDAGVFHLQEGYRGIVMPIQFVAIKAGSPILTFTAESDSKYSPTEVKLKTPIK